MGLGFVLYRESYNNYMPPGQRWYTPHDGTYDLGPWTPSTDEAQHHAAIAEIRRQIREGHTYQVNHTFRLDAPFEGDALALILLSRDDLPSELL